MDTQVTERATRAACYARARELGNARMRRGGRQAWSWADYSAAARAYIALLKAAGLDLPKAGR